MKKLLESEYGINNDGFVLDIVSLDIQVLKYLLKISSHYNCALNFAHSIGSCRRRQHGHEPALFAVS